MKLIPLILLPFLFLSCQAAQRRGQSISDIVTAVEDARGDDGVVTDEEFEKVKERADIALYEARSSSPPWLELVLTSIATLGLGLLGVRYIPNSAIIGRREANALDRATRLQPPG